MGQQEFKDRILDFIKNYVAYIATIIVCVIYLTFDLIKLTFETEPIIAVVRSIIYIAMSFTITSLLRMQGIIHGKADNSYIKSMEEYNKAINDNLGDADRLDDWCELKNDMKRVAEIKKRLKYAHLSFDEFEKGTYEIPNDKKKLKAFKKTYSKRQYKAIIWCNKLEVNIFDSGILTDDLVKEGTKQKVHNESVSKYMNKKGGTNLLTGVASSIAFAFVTIDLAKDFSWANFFFSCIKVGTWLISGIMALIFSFIYITTTYVDSIKNKTVKLIEFNKWCIEHPKVRETNINTNINIIKNKEEIVDYNSSSEQLKESKVEEQPKELIK